MVRALSRRGGGLPHGVVLFDGAEENILQGGVGGAR